MNQNTKSEENGVAAMKRKMFLLFLLVSFFCGIIFKYYYDEFSYYPNRRVVGQEDNGLLEQVDVIPDKKTAIKIAKILWLPIYGKKYLLGYSYKVELVGNEIWAIAGVKNIHRIFGTKGGGPYIEIEKKTGLVLKIGHTGADPKVSTK